MTFSRFPWGWSVQVSNKALLVVAAAFVLVLGWALWKRAKHKRMEKPE